MHEMSDDLKCKIAQGLAWFSVILGGVSFEVWIALAGLAISAFISWTNYRSRKFQDKLLAEQAVREEEWHAMEKERLEILRKHPSMLGPEEVLRSTRPPEMPR